jgi:cysteine-S-conjugate beta-lyase
LPGSPGHEHWANSASAAACLFSVAFKPEVTSAQVDAFCDRLELFRIGYSWAGPVSLCVPYNIPAMRSRPWSYAPHLVRLAIGLEAVDDLQADLAQALSALS